MDKRKSKIWKERKKERKESRMTRTKLVKKVVASNQGRGC